MSWVRLNMRFPGTCLECRKRVKVGEQALWSRGVGVKHIECAEQIAGQGPNIACAVCGGPAGCGTCELADSCDTKKVSPLCICSRCNSGDAMAKYAAAVAGKFPALSRS
jgi:hypothetical protein